MMLDICPKCHTNNFSMVWLGKGKGWLCEDCLAEEKATEQKATKEGKDEQGHSIRETYKKSRD